MKRGLLLFAHGARDPRWALPFEAVAERIRARDSDVTVTLCFLELMTPSLRDAAESLVAEGCSRIDVLPLFLGAGGHVRKDLPLLFDALRAAHPVVAWSLHPPVGELDGVIDAMVHAALTLSSGA